jgi:hypothetical protein
MKYDRFTKLPAVTVTAILIVIVIGAVVVDVDADVAESFRGKTWKSSTKETDHTKWKAANATVVVFRSSICYYLLIFFGSSRL